MIRRQSRRPSPKLFQQSVQQTGNLIEDEAEHISYDDARHDDRDEHYKPVHFAGADKSARTQQRENVWADAHADHTSYKGEKIIRKRLVPFGVMKHVDIVISSACNANLFENAIQSPECLLYDYDLRKPL